MKLALGTAQFGLDYGINNQRGKIPSQEVETILDLAYQNQIRIIDTALNYGNSEKIIGRYLKKNKQNFKIVTKLPAIKNYSEIKQNLDQSCQNLNIDKIYAYLIHDFKTIKKFPDSVKYIREDVRAKKVGFSLYNPSELDYLWKNKIYFDIIQVPYNIFDQRFAPYFKKLKSQQVEIHTRSVFLQGLFFKEPENLPRHFSRIKVKIEAMRNLSEEIDVSISGLCLNFANLNEFVDKIVVGVDSLSNLNENIKSLQQKQKVAKIYDQLIALKENNTKIILPTNWKLNQ